MKTRNVLILLAVLIVIILTVSLSSEKFMQPQDPVDLKSCNSVNDCQIVQGKACCHCPTAINVKYLDYWEKRPYDNCGYVQCTPCPAVENLTLTCKENRCGYDYNRQ